MGRSRELTRGNLGKIFLVALLAAMVFWVVFLVFYFVLQLVPWPHPMLHVFFQTLSQAVLMPVTVAPIILVYYDLRIRKEAFDLQMLSDAMEPPAAL
jgi:hypothetical protein